MPCQQCGQCCLNGCVLREEDARFIEIHPDMVDYTDGRPHTKVVGGRCIALTKDNQCSVYDDRPTGCRMFPKPGREVECTSMNYYRIIEFEGHTFVGYSDGIARDLDDLYEMLYKKHKTDKRWYCYVVEEIPLNKLKKITHEQLKDYFNRTV